MRQTARPKTQRKRGEGGVRAQAREVGYGEEGSDDDGAISLNAIKNKYKSGGGSQSKGNS